MANLAEQLIDKCINEQLTFTVLKENSLTGYAMFVGTFDTEEKAVSYAKKQAARSRSFITFTLHTGTPKQPVEPIPGQEYGGS